MPDVLLTLKLADDRKSDIIWTNSFGGIIVVEKLFPILMRAALEVPFLAHSQKPVKCIIYGN